MLKPENQKPAPSGLAASTPPHYLSSARKSEDPHTRAIAPSTPRTKQRQPKAKSLKQRQMRRNRRKQRMELRRPQWCWDRSGQPSNPSPRQGQWYPIQRRSAASAMKKKQKRKRRTKEEDREVKKKRLLRRTWKWIKKKKSSKIQLQHKVVWKRVCVYIHACIWWRGRLSAPLAFAKRSSA